MHIYIDGNFYSKDDAKISVFDHGLLYGDGIFEGIRAYGGKVFMVREHLERLYDSAKGLLLTIPMNIEELEKSVLETCKKNEIEEGYIRLLVTRGKGSLGLSPDLCEKPTVVIIAGEISLYPEKYYKEGLKVVTVPTRRTSQAAISPSIKSLNYLNNVMARIEASHMGAQEGILLNSDGYVAECSGDNIFIRKNEKWLTPPTYVGALDGITRHVVFHLLKEKAELFEEKILTRYDLFTADEIFLTGTGAEIIPVVSVDARQIGDGMPGKKTLDLVNIYREFARSSGVSIS